MLFHAMPGLYYSLSLHDKSEAPADANMTEELLCIRRETAVAVGVFAAISTVAVFLVGFVVGKIRNCARRCRRGWTAMCEP